MAMPINSLLSSLCLLEPTDLLALLILMAKSISENTIYVQGQALRDFIPLSST